MRESMARLVAAATGALVIAGVVLFATLRWQTSGISEEDIDPRRWAVRFPRHVERSLMTETDYGRTVHGGSVPYDKLEANPFRRRAFAGHPFALEYNAARGHYYAQVDQRESQRTLQRDQPAACIHCHAAEAPQLLAEYGWEEFHRHSYNDLRDRLHHGSSCGDCHAPENMELRVTRPAFVQAMQQRGIDVSEATREQMRTYVCAQCHVEYYFRGEDRELVLPWQEGIRLEEIEQYYDDIDFHDWTHAETGAPLIKIQHPEYELYSTGTHARRGVSCADCHMPSMHDGGLKMTDHWIRSPMVNIQNACMHCHSGSAESLAARTVAIQDRTTEQLQVTEGALADLMNAIVAAQEAGADDAALENARRYHRRAQMRWDFVDAENSTGFHSPHEVSRLLLHAVDLARQGERSAIEARHDAR